jgi:hypothetical protein
MRTYRERLDELAERFDRVSTTSSPLGSGVAFEDVAFELDVDVLARSTGEGGDRISDAEACVLVPVLRRVRDLLPEPRSATAEDVRRAVEACRNLLAAGEAQAIAWTP